MPHVQTESVGSGLRERFENVLARIRMGAARCGRQEDDVRLIAISKTHPVDVIRNLVEIGATDLGENRVQEAESKILEIGTGVRWHLVGHLQANKARRAVKLFDVIHSLDASDLAHRLNDLCEQEDKKSLAVLIQIDVGKEATKSGIEEKELPSLAEQVQGLSRLELTGLMPLPPFFDNPADARPYFARLRELRDELGVRGFFKDKQGELSMGMTNDFEVAIEEGATMVRVGTAIFGERA